MSWIKKFQFSDNDTFGFSLSAKRRFEATKRFSLLALVCNTTFACNDFLTIDNKIIIAIDCLILPINLIIYLYFRYTKKQQTTAIILMAFLNIMLISTSSFYTRASNLELLFFPMMILTFSITDHKKKWLQYGMVSLIAASVIIIEFTDFKLFSFGQINPEQVTELAHLTCLTSVILFFVFLSTMRSVITQNEEKLQTDSKLLLSTNQKLNELILLNESYNERLKTQLLEAEKLLLEKERELKMAALHAEETERKRIANDLHDELGVKLSTLKMNISKYENIFKDEARVEFNNILNLVDEACHQIRNISHAMHPSLFEENGLVITLKDLIKNINDTGKIEVKMVVIDYEKHLSNQKEIMVYRILLELLNNTLKHAKATHVNLQIIKNNNQLSIMYDDNGIGYQLSEINKGIGLYSIEHRTNVLNANWKVESSKDRGTFNLIELLIQ
ncbi:MAG: Signal transduction histidine-protein kinase/phosphatase DegS [Bacteroidota bacterium]|jgi:signal transduction histidine kinase